MKKYISDVKQLKMNKFIKSIWQWNISTWNGTLKVTSLRPYRWRGLEWCTLRNLGNCSSCRKALKWKTKIAVHMMEEVILNAFILYNKPGRSMGLLKFKLQFIRSILISKRDNNSLVVRTNSTYFLESIPLTSRKSNSRGRCANCYEKKQRKEVCYRCKSWDQKHSLCTVPCFKEITAKNKNYVI